MIRKPLYKLALLAFASLTLSSQASAIDCGKLNSKSILECRGFVSCINDHGLTDASCQKNKQRCIYFTHKYNKKCLP